MEYKAVVQQAHQDVLFSEAAPTNDDEAAGVAERRAGGGTSSTAELVRARGLKRQDFVTGMRVLGAVSEVSSDRLLLQLPNRHTGRINRSEVSDELHAAMTVDEDEQEGAGFTPPDLRRIFRRGEVLCCAVLPLSSRVGATPTPEHGLPPVELTLRLSIVQKAALAQTPRLHRGCVLWATMRSSEEYGFVMHTTSQAGGFLHKTKWVPPERVPSEGLAAGGGSAAADPTASAARWRPYLCSVVSGGVQQPRKPVQLASVGAGAPPLPLPQDTALRFEALQPGMVVSAQIAGFLADGLRLVFCGYFEGTVACDALGVAMPMTSPQWAKRFTVGAKVSARLLWVLPAHKAVGLSLVPSLVACIPYTPPRPLGSLVQTTTCIVCPGGALIVAQAESDTSGYVSGDGAADDDTGRSRKKARSAAATEEMGEGASGTLIGGAWVARSQLDLQPRQKAADALRQLKVGARHRGVVMGIRWLEGLLEVSLRPSALSQTWLRYEQVAVGHVLKGTIARIDARGARVRLGRGVYGTCGAAHLTERRLQRPQEKFSTGQAVQCLVLESEPLREKLVLSLKTALVTSTLPRVTRYEDATPGLTTHGVVAALRPRSITIRLLGGVSGIVRGSELKARFGALWESEPTACYREGQVVSCTVISCDPAQRKMLLTLLSAEEAASRPAGALLNRAAAGKKETTDKLTADQPAKKRKERPGAAEAEAEGDVSWTSRLEEAVEGRHSLATAVALGDHGQLVCRLDRKGAVRGRIHMTELADVGRDAVLPTTVPDEPIHVVVVGRAGGSVELSMRPAELGAPRGSMPVPRVSMSSLAAGQIHPGWVRDVSAEAVWVCLSYAATGRVVAIEASDDPKVLTRLAKHFRVGMAVTVRVLGTGSPRDDGGGIQLDLSLRLGAAAAPLPATSSKTASKKGVAATTASAAAGELAVGAVVPAKIVRARPGRGLDVQLGAALYGRAHATEICDEWVAEPLSSFEPGQFVRAVVLAVPEAGATGNGGGSGIEVSLRSAAVAAALAASGKKKRDGHERVKDAEQVEEGELVRGYVKAISAKGCFVSLSRTVDGFVGLRHLSDEFVKVEAVSELVPVGSLVVARALPRKGVTRGALPLSLRRSDVEGGAYLEPEASLTFDALHAGMVAIGKVKSVTEFGIFVRLDGSTIDALCHKTEVSDRKVGNLSEAFPLGTAVKVAILKVNPEKKQVSGSMRRSRLDELEGDEDDAVLVREELRRRKATKVDDEDEHEDEEDEEGEEGEGEGEDEDEDEDEDEGEEEEVGDMDDDDDDEGEGDGEEDEEEEDEEEDQAEPEEEEEEEEEEEGTNPYGEDLLALLAKRAAANGVAATAVPVPHVAPALSASFVWDDDRSAKMSAEQPSLLDGAVEAEMEPAGGQTSRKGRRAQEAAAARDEEAAIAAREAELGSAPRSAEDFERLLLGSPNSSYMWMRYISFQLNLTEIERARQVGERALRTIALTEHKERFNIHAALLNLEKAHGDEETLAAAVARALQGCDPKQVYLHVASMHERAGDALLADAAFEVAAKKFRPHSDVWIAWMTALMARGVPAQAKAILQRAVDALPRASHVEVISKFAQLEFRYGLPERGRTVFDGVLANYPKRVDVWSIYIDMQLRQAEPESTRRLFERVTSLRLSSKKMKYFFSRYLKYARESGDAQLVAHVKEKARAWVESAAGDREPPK